MVRATVTCLTSARSRTKSNCQIDQITVLSEKLTPFMKMSLRSKMKVKKFFLMVLNYQAKNKKFSSFWMHIFIKQHKSRSIWVPWQVLSYFGFLEHFGKNSKRSKINTLQYVMVKHDFRPFWILSKMF